MRQIVQSPAPQITGLSLPPSRHPVSNRGAFLLSPAIAAQVRTIGQAAPPVAPRADSGPAAGAPPSGTGGTTYGAPAASGQIDDGKGTNGALAPASSGTAPATTVAPDAKPRHYRLGLTAPPAQAFAAFEALTMLADVANRMQITIEVVAEQPSGFDQVYVRNAVIEPLEETGLPVRIEAEE